MYQCEFTELFDTYNDFQCVLEPIDRCWAYGADDLQNTIEVVELLEHQHDLHDARHHGHALVDILGLQDTTLHPECELQSNEKH